MPYTVPKSTLSRTGSLLGTFCAAALLSAGGGGATDSSETAIQAVAAPLASGTTTLQIEVETLSEEVAAHTVQPAFHMAPTLLDTLDDADPREDNLSAHRRLFTTPPRVPWALARWKAVGQPPLMKHSVAAT
jgi:hypothetical protein